MRRREPPIRQSRDYADLRSSLSLTPSGSISTAVETGGFLAKKLPLTLTSARAKEPFDLGGNFFWFKTSNLDDATITVLFDSDAQDGIELLPGEGLGPFNFNKIYVTHDAQTGVEIVLYALKFPADPAVIQP